MIPLPTAREFLFKNADRFQSTTPDEWLIEFTKLHVQAALKAASEKAIIHEDYEECYTSDYVCKGKEQHYCIETDRDGMPCSIRKYSINETSILNSYPLENIK